MIEKEVAELRRRFKVAKTNITKIRGCYVNRNGDIISEFRQSLSVIPNEHAEQILGILKKTMSGTMGKNLINIEFETAQVISGAEHKLLSQLRDTRLEDDDVVHEFYNKAIESLDLESNYIIMLAHDTYDVPYRSKDGSEDADNSSEMFSYIICAICPMKETKPALDYCVAEDRIRNIAGSTIIGPPELGFMFPAFDERATNIYNALYYNRDTKENHEDFANAIFAVPLAMPAAAQKETFQSILSGAVANDCSYEVVQAVHNTLSNMVMVQKEREDAKPLFFSKDTVKNVLKDCGVSEQHISAFDTRYDEEFGKETELPPENVVDLKKLEVKSANVMIQVNADRSDLVKTQIIDGRPYILIRAESGVEVNGVSIAIPKD